MAVRVISAVVGLPILIFFVAMGGIFLKTAVAVMALIGMYELYTAVSGKIKPVHFIGFVAMLVYSFVPHSLLIEYMLPLVSVSVLCIMIMLVFFHNSININDGSVTVLGFLYVGVLIYNIYFLRELPMGSVYVWLPFICAFGSDTGAYFIGVKFGKHKLAPVLSPKKSIEGSVGGIVSGAVLCGIYYLVADKLGYMDYENSMIVPFIIFGAVASGFSQLGDLAASSVKRYTGIKDYGNIMPGHGGVLDRFDSVLFTAPVIYILVRYFV